MEKEIIISFIKPYIEVADKPASFNSFVRIRKYKITIEEIEESVEILQKRLEDLWKKETNFHQYQPLQNEAKKLNYIFENDFGKFSKKSNLTKK